MLVFFVVLVLLDSLSAFLRPFSNNKELSFETGKIGRQASGSAFVKSSDNIIYSTACYDRELNPANEFVPLKVDFFSRYSSIGQTINTFHRRDGRGDDEEILISRVVDRSLRPTVSDGWVHDTQILQHVLSYDRNSSLEPLAICAASASLALSEVPTSHSVAGVEVVIIPKEENKNSTMDASYYSFVVNPTFDEISQSIFRVILAGHSSGILMMEASGSPISSDLLLQCLREGHSAITKISQTIESFGRKYGKPKKRDTLLLANPSVRSWIDQHYGMQLRDALNTSDKQQRGAKISQLESTIEGEFAKISGSVEVPSKPKSQHSSISNRLSSSSSSSSSKSLTDIIPEEDELASENESEETEEVEVDDSNAEGDNESNEEGFTAIVPEKPFMEEEASELSVLAPSVDPDISLSPPSTESWEIRKAVKKLLSEYLQNAVKKNGRRCDYRTKDEIRAIDIELGFLPRVHGSALFTRGETQSLATVTLGGYDMEAKISTLSSMNRKKFYLQYKFPSSSIGEVSMRPTSLTRREIGHGMLAERALKALVEDECSLSFPYSIRGESLITESSGSSSMATICGCWLAMKDAGVPLKTPVAGVAMGMFMDKKATSSKCQTMEDCQSYEILSDILGLEDALGNMDMKIAGTREHITAVQLDLKDCSDGLTWPSLQAIFSQAEQGRNQIIDKMEAVVPKGIKSLPASFQRLLTVEFPRELTGKIIGVRGKVIQQIISDCEVENISIKDHSSNSSLGVAQISSWSDEKNHQARCALEIIIDEALAFQASVDQAENNHDFTEDGSDRTDPNLEVEVPVPPMNGEIFRECEIKHVEPFGVFVEVKKGYRGLVHISELDVRKVDQLPSSQFSVGMKIDVKCLGYNEKGQIRLSRKALLLREDPRYANSQRHISPEVKEAIATYQQRKISYEPMIPLRTK